MFVDLSLHTIQGVRMNVYRGLQRGGGKGAHQNAKAITEIIQSGKSLFTLCLNGSCSIPLAFCFLGTLLPFTLDHYLPRVTSASLLAGIRFRREGAGRGGTAGSSVRGRGKESGYQMGDFGHVTKTYWSFTSFNLIFRLSGVFRPILNVLPLPYASPWSAEQNLGYLANPNHQRQIQCFSLDTWVV